MNGCKNEDECQTPTRCRHLSRCPNASSAQADSQDREAQQRVRSDDGSALSGYDRDVLRTAKENHIWLNAFACVRPTTELRLQLADQILALLNDKSNLIYDHQDSAAENWRALGKLTPELIVRINKS